MQAKMLEFQEDFEVWFATIQDILDEDTAGNLLNLINANSADITAHEEAADPHSSMLLIPIWQLCKKKLPRMRQILRHKQQVRVHLW